ncbi:MAG: DUF1018 domain-containing protein [Caulobacter sp.]|nr:DUF1018 domain-containing protein [Caulobacter sp.]
MPAASRRDPRAPMIAKVHMGAKALGLDDDTRRALMVRVGGKSSAAEMTTAELGKVLDEYRRQGWGASKPARLKKKAADHPVAGKARAMWISLHQLGVVRDPSETALEAFARRQLQVEVFQWADQGLAYKLIEALKAMAERAGWSQDVAGLKGRAAVGELKRRLAVLIALREGEAIG